MYGPANFEMASIVSTSACSLLKFTQTHAVCPVINVDVGRHAYQAVPLAEACKHALMHTKLYLMLERMQENSYVMLFAGMQLRHAYNGGNIHAVEYPPLGQGRESRKGDLPS